MTPIETTDVERSDIPFLEKAARHCRARAAMAWGDKERARLTRLAAWNLELADKARKQSC